MRGRKGSDREVEEMMNPLRALAERGRSVRLDFLSREFRRPGDRERLVREDGLPGATTNPSIFEKAVGQCTGGVAAREALDSGPFARPTTEQ
jgi:transaldolase/glucose-6-phosphate isomerase